MTLNINQFNQSTVQGALDLKFGGAVVSCQIDVSSAGSLVPGTAVKVVDSAGGVPKVVEIAADTDEVFGFICYDQKQSNFDAYSPCEIALVNGGACMFMTASAAIARNAVVCPVISGVKVKTSTGGGRDVGRAYDKAAADGELIRVLLLPKTTVTA
jgi:hypothetical protein